MSSPATPMSREEKLALLARLARERANRPKKAPLSFAQQRHYFLTRLDPDSFAHTIFRAFRLDGELDAGALEAAAADVLRRHESLRATFVENDGELLQHIAPPSVADDFRLPAEDRRQDQLVWEQIEAILAEEARRPFDLARELPIRWRLLRLEEHRWLLILAIHHIVADGWSLGILLREFRTAYAARRRGEAPAFAPLPIEFSDFASWQQETLNLELELNFWKNTLGGAPLVLEVPGDFPRPALASLAGDAVGFSINAEKSAALRQRARAAGATPFMWLLSAFSLLLHRSTGQNDLLVGTPIANRNRKEIEGLIGSFANTLVLRSRYDGTESFSAHLGRIRDSSLAAFDHQELPFERLVEELHPQRDLSRNPLFQVMFAMVDGGGSSGISRTRTEIPLGDGLEISSLDIDRGLSKVDLTLEIQDRGDDFGGYFEYATDLYEKSTIERFGITFLRLLDNLLSLPEMPLARLPLLSPESRAQVLIDWNATASTADIETPLPRVLLERALAQPEATAVIEAPAFRAAPGALGQERSLTYGQLASASARLATRLQAAGVGRGDLVGLCLERSLEATVAFLAVWRAGAAYVALDPAYPAERLAYMITDSGLSLLLSQERLRARLPETPATVLLLDDLLTADLDAAVPERKDPELGGDDLAYVIYTSGSTGRPKGVMVPHRGLKNHAKAIERHYQLTASDRVLQFASLSFDLAGEEIYPTWVAGATLVLRSEQQSLALADFLRFLDAEKISVANLPTPYWHEWVIELQNGRCRPPQSLRLVIVGTEQALVERLEGWRAALGEFPRWVNSYGPSETTITATSWDMPPAGGPELRRVAIGRPIDNLTAYVLDAALEPMPPGLPGELCLGGAGLAHGYHQRPALTAEKFVPDPFSTVPGARLYRSGDKVRFLPDGNLEFLGRLDNQVKVRGFRIEVGEIEAFLADHPAVADVVVLAREVAAGDRRLVACLSLSGSGSASPGLEAELRSWLEARLPAYMVPGVYLILPSLPLTPSGKVDRAALLNLPLTTETLDDAPWEAPRDPVEEVVAEIWSSLLGGRRVGVHDDFFRLGGHSLLATRMLSRLRATFGIELPLKDVFEAPQLGALAARVAAARAGDKKSTPPLEAATRGEELPLSFTQQRMWFLAQLEPDSPAYNMPTAVRLEGPLDVPCLEKTLSEILRRHESLRTTFAAQRGQPRQMIQPPIPVSLHVREVADVSAAEKRAAELSLVPFQLAVEIPVRFELLRVAPERAPEHPPEQHWLILIFHHIVSDGWSTDLFLHELQVLYAAYSAGQGSPLPELPLQYVDFALWQGKLLAEGTLDADLEYWKKRLAGAPDVLDLPTDRPRPPHRRHLGARVPFEIGHAAGESLRELGRRQGCSLFMTFYAAWATYLSRITHSRDILVGTPIAGRHRPEVERLIGFFANTLVLRLDLEGRPTTEKLLRQARERVLEAYDHQDLPFEKLVDELRPQRSTSHSPLFQVTCVLHHASTFENDHAVAAPQAGEPALRLSLPSVDNGTARFDLALVLVEREHGFRGFLEYDLDLFDRPSIERHVRAFLHLLTGMAAEPTRPVAELPLLPPADLAAVLSPWPDLQTVDPDQEASISELFARAAARFPDRPALTCEGVSLSYRELDVRSAAIAAALRQRGVGLESRVGIAIERSLDLVVGILGILRADAAYVPIDPASPLDRMAYILEDCGADLLLSRESQKLPNSQTPRLDLEAIDLTAAPAAENLAGRATGANLAYVIYTSGSTGRPKGVAVTHGNATRLMRSTEAWFSPNENDVWTLFHSSAFDFSVWELWGPLLYGGRLVVVPYFVSRSAEAFHQLLVDENVTVLNMTPSMFRQVDRADEESTVKAGGHSPLKTLRLVIFGGEAVDLQGLAGWWRRHPADAPSLVNMYGITETTVHVTYRPLAPSVLELPVASVIGRPIPDLSVYLLDRLQQPLPMGVPGEICVGGAGLARYYLGRPALTAERFVPNPFATRPGERLYRSGDLGRLLEVTEQGKTQIELDYHGRIDLQVKIRGFRIELGEIEASLSEQESVHEAIVLARGEGDERKLVAYLTLSREARAGGQPENELISGLIRQWRQALLARLPEYMVPSAFVVLETFPLTVNGKVDRKALPAPELDRLAVGANYVAPRNEVEAQVVAIWQEILGHEQIGVEDDFFELGGHSLLATRVLARLREAFDADLPLRLLFEKKTVAALAEEIVSRGVAAGVENADEELLRRLLEEL